MVTPEQVKESLTIEAQAKRLEAEIDKALLVGIFNWSIGDISDPLKVCLVSRYTEAGWMVSEGQNISGNILRFRFPKT